MTYPEPSTPKRPAVRPAGQHYGPPAPQLPVSPRLPMPQAHGQAVQHPMYAPQPLVVTAPKSAGIAVLLSLLWFGAGHLYANRTGVGIALILYHAFLAFLSATVIGLVVSVPLWLISLPIVLILASNAANDYNRRNGLVVR